jgi:dienelactone hydrolase
LAQHSGRCRSQTITQRANVNATANADSEAQFAQAISFYPGCSSYANSTRLAKLSAPLALFIGGADDWTPAAPCEAWVKRLQAEKQTATITVYPDAFHDFDAPNSKLRVRKDVPNGVNPGKGVTVGADPLARALVKKEVELLLKSKQLMAN